MSTDSLRESNNTAARRLWFLQVLLDKMEPERALALASRMEAFVAIGGTLPTKANQDKGSNAPRVHGESAAAGAGVAGEAWKVFQPTVESSPSELGAEAAGGVTRGSEVRKGRGRDFDSGSDTDRSQRPEVLDGRLAASSVKSTGEVGKSNESPESLLKTPSGNSPGRLLTREELQAFQDQALNGATNQDLAQRFGLTPRQANGIRMGLAKRVPQIALKRIVAKPPKMSLDRATELQMQSEFLQQKVKTPATVEDVVRYLRQRGDVVTRSGSVFSINYRLSLTEEELFRRANEKRAQLGLPAFNGNGETSQATAEPLSTSSFESQPSSSERSPSALQNCDVQGVRSTESPAIARVVDDIVAD